MTDQWDENRQDWTTPDRPEGPPPGERSTRVAVVTALAVLLCVAVVAGIWALARNSGDGGSNAGLPGLSAPSESYAAETAGAGAGGGGGVPSDPCSAVSDEMAQEWGLQRDTTTTAEAGCQWLLQDDDTFLVSLDYTDEPPRQYDGTTPIPVDGVPSAGSYSLSGSCLVEWPTSFGSVLVLASELSHTGSRDLCDLAADFAGAVAPAVPD